VTTTKKTWGAPTFTAETLLAMGGYVGPDEGRIVIFKAPRARDT
jgi:hypothetical protein